MATQTARITALAQAIGADIKAIGIKEGSLANLSTTDKTSLVNAINELKSAVASATGINDSAQSSASTYSSNKIVSTINAAIAALVAGAPTALDTLKEISDQLATDEGVTATLLTAVGNRVRFDADQSTTLTSAQKQVARTNIDAYGSTEIGNPDTDLVTAYNTAKS